MSNWIHWCGGEQPVTDDTIVEVEMRAGDVIDRIAANELDWFHGSQYDTDGDYDIVAYRVVK